jgi:hypothetical protein
VLTSGGPADRLAVLELKASEDTTFRSRLDYWMQVAGI